MCSSPYKTSIILDAGEWAEIGRLCRQPGTSPEHSNGVIEGLISPTNQSLATLWGLDNKRDVSMQRGEWDRRLRLRCHTSREHRPGEHACDALNCDNPQPTHRAPTAFFKEWVPAPIVILYKRLLPKTNVFTLAELLAGFGSKLGELTTAVFVIDSLSLIPKSAP